MGLKHVQRTYDDLGERDPLYAILSFPEAKDNRWDPEAFFARGRREIDTVLEHLAALGYSPRRGRAMDFGCGVGRLSQALAEHFDTVDGVDIAASMIERARSFNRHGNRCRYHVNTTADLARFESGAFDFIYSNITLQHVPPEASEAYVGEFVRLLAPGGLALFQVPDGPRIDPGTLRATWYGLRRGPLRRAWKRLRGKAPVEIHWVNRERIRDRVEAAGGRVLAAWQEGSVRRERVSRFYLATTGRSGARPQPRSAEPFEGAPWRDMALDARTVAVPSMLSEDEQKLYAWVTARWMNGVAEVVDLGCFAGGSTARLAAGHATARHGGRIHAYDRFSASEGVKRRVLYDQGVAPFNGSDIFPLTQRHLAPWTDRVVFHRGEIEELGWNGRPIEVLCVDVFKIAETMDLMARQFYPALLPGRSLILHQDFLCESTPWIAAQMQRLMHRCEAVAVVDDTVAFLVREAITPEDLQAASVADVSDDDLRESLAAWRPVLAPLSDHAADQLEAARRWLDAHPGARTAW